MIEIGSKWQHKDGGVYEVVKVMDCAIHENNLHYDGLEVWYKDKENEICVRTEKHFLASFKPYEPVYEWKWAVQSKDTYGRIQLTSYKTESEFIEWESKQDETLVYQRLDFTKRERKC